MFGYTPTQTQTHRHTDTHIQMGDALARLELPHIEIPWRHDVHGMEMKNPSQMEEIVSQQCIVTIIVLGPEGNDNKVACTSNGIQ